MNYPKQITGLGVRTWVVGFTALMLSIALSMTAPLASAASDNNDASAGESVDIVQFLSPNTDSTPLWAAYSQGFYKDAGLNVTVRTFPSGTTAFQAYRSGLGTFVMSGDLPSLQYWINSDHDYRAIQVLTRNTEGYVIEALASIKKPQDLIGKSVATRVGSSGSWFLSEYLAKNGISKDDVKVLNLDTNQMPIALCREQIAAYFVWQPFGDQAERNCGDKVHQLSDAEGYMRGYTVLGARPEWLKKHRQAAIAYVKATVRGAVWAEKHPKELAEYLDTHYGADAKFSERALTYMNLTPLFNSRFRDDFTRLSKWNMERAAAEGSKAEPIDFDQFIWTDGVDALTKDELPSIPQAATGSK